MKEIVKSGALDLMQIFYGHLFNVDGFLDQNPRPNLSDAKVIAVVHTKYIKPAREIFEEKLNSIEKLKSNSANKKELLALFDEFNNNAYRTLVMYQKLENPTLEQTLEHRYQTVGQMARNGVKVMDLVLGRDTVDSNEFQEAFFHSAMAAQIHDDLTDVKLDEKMVTNENMVHAFLRHNGEYGKAKPFFGIMTSNILKKVAPKSFYDVKKFESEHIAQIPKDAKFEILRKFPSVF
jgi:hypothetical protein